MADMDQGIKRLLQTHPADVLTLAVPGVEYLGPIATDVATEPQLVLDTLFRVRYHGEECAINVEAQAYPDASMPRRCFEYGSRASIVHGLPVLSLVLWLQRRGAVPTSPYEMRVGSWVQSTWHFFGVEVYMLRAADIVATASLGLLPLVPFMQGADTAVIERAARVVKERDSQRPEDAEDLVSLLAVFMAHFHGEDAARAMVRRVFMSTEILDQSPLFRSMIREATEKGLAEGEAKGEAKGLREAARAVLEGRFGTLDADTLAALSAADDATLKALLPHLGTDTLAQVRERLGLPEA